ncbi:MAG: DUF885 family protein, partial [Hyphomonadaceae bacterium]|nr:DUF885 family protein [Hyphomonadaceae bacterium]
MKTSRRRVVLALGSTVLVPLMGADAFAQTPSRADRAFEALGRGWLDRSMRLSPVSATGTGDHRFDREIDDVSAAGRNAGLRFAHDTLRQLEAIDKTQLSRANQVDYAILGNSLRAGIWQTETWQTWAWNPLGYQGLAGGALYSLMAREFAPLPQRLESAIYRLEKMPRLLEQTRAALVPSRVPAPHAATYAAQNPGLKSIVTGMIEPHKGELSASKQQRLERAIAAFNAAVDEHQTWITETLVPAAQADFRAGAETFDTQLGYTLLSNLSRADIRSRADAAVISVRQEMYRVSKQALARRPGAPATPEAPTPEQQQVVIRAALD